MPPPHGKDGREVSRRFSQFVWLPKQSSNALTPLVVFRKLTFRVLPPSALSKKLRLLGEQSRQFIPDLGHPFAP
jgi:hypothetical protein